ncbi:uncharacterized protein A4U43_C04F34990 [Asparagus officinalis]|uniref:GTP cyclohydrolase 1 n=1 Tax=Asparagus officinalis TaxID=4686 RepID=A0A5P1FB58_ASPOF|nr:GTP cyclohydrolase 1 [Asparagus officinalis]ONK73760.1 uncharacterized protein A4U43_C04F34990 [Asparagus officinalis]
MGALEDIRFVEEMALELSADCGSDSGAGSGSEPEPESNKEIEEAVKVLLQGLGEDHEREGIKRTPFRVAKAFRDGTKGYGQKVKDIVEGALFPEAGLENTAGYAGGTGGLVVVRDINLFSFCESCLLPFSIQCHIGYIPAGHRVVGLSKLSRVADVFAKRLQDPQRLANEICSALQTSIKPAGVSVVLQCWHIQFPETQKNNLDPKHPSEFEMQGWVQSSVCSSSGVLENEGNSFRDDFLSLLKFRGINVDSGSSLEYWCPSRSLKMSKSGVTQSAMISAVASILQSLGEDPMRQELLGTPYRYVHWLMNFKKSILEPKLNGLSLRSINSPKRIGGIHSELNLPFCSQCEHHLLPFYGVVHVGYYCEKEEEVIERSYIHSIVHFYGCKLQVQERLTKQIAETIYSVVGRGVIVVVEANHICMISRGIEKIGSSTATIAVMGEFASDRGSKALFLDNISKSTASWG